VPIQKHTLQAEIYGLILIFPGLNFRDHIFIHLRYLLCQYGCSQGFFAENDRKRHESTCTLRESGVKEQPLPLELVELRRKVESLKCSRMDKSKIVRELESLLLSREGPTRMRKIFDAYDSTNSEAPSISRFPTSAASIMGHFNEVGNQGYSGFRRMTTPTQERKFLVSQAAAAAAATATAT